ncbi:predicted protein [Thalassiosira pseudonana CCMP1335]|uniref:Uncharacterized protein n=1 Tax=Thalassiosira pseudonana TaxID=35128 RepID=B8LBN0_THAPS|nr:predicted protein [Thalassiosira pseudonana CCMP1335]EED87211.1 predicted protein [Thalassiosira pseudonana CCMP1335]
MKSLRHFKIVLMLVIGIGIPPADATRHVGHQLHPADVDIGADNDKSAIILNDIMTTQLSTRSFSPSSPQCWMTSITTINHWKGTQDDPSVSSGRDYCASMTSDQQKLIALEMTNCQLKEGNRPMFDANKITYDELGVSSVTEHSSVYQSCPVGKQPSHAYDVSSCLPLLSQDAWNLYHQILLYTNDVCTRLTDEIMIRQKKEATQMLVHVSSSLSRHLKSVLDDTEFAVERIRIHSVMLEDQSLMMKEQRNELEVMYHNRKKEEMETIAMVREQSVLLEEQSHRMKEQQLQTSLAMEQLSNHTKEQTALIIAEQAQRQSALFEEQSVKLRDQQLEMDRMHKQREDAASLAIKEQAEMIREQQRDLERMQELIANANSQMQPLSTIESYVKLATYGFTVFQSTLNFFLSMNGVWLLTALPLLHRSRRSLFGVFLAGFVVELIVIWFGGNNLLSSQSPTMDDLLRSQMEFMSRMNATASMERSNVINGMNRSVAEETFIITDKNYKPRNRRTRSRSSHCTTSAKASLPVVTPAKNRGSSNAVTPTASESKSPHANHRRSDEYVKEMQHSSESEASSTPQTIPKRTNQTIPKRTNKRKYSEAMDASGSSKDECSSISTMSVQYNVNNDDDDSMSTVSSGVSSESDGSQQSIKKKCKFSKAKVY